MKILHLLGIAAARFSCLTAACAVDITSPSLLGLTSTSENFERKRIL